MKNIFYIFCVLFSSITFAIDNIPADDEKYIYGLGVDVDHQQARKLAQADITHKLSSKVQSSINIAQSKTGNNTKSNIKQNTRATSHEIELPNIHVMKNEQKNGQWWVLIRVERALILQSLQQQLVLLSEEISFMLDDYAQSPGPACWFALTKNNPNQSKINNLLPAFVGSGGSIKIAEKYQHQSADFSKLSRKCAHYNKYAVSYPEKTDSSFKHEFEKLMKAQGYKISGKAKNVGTLKVILKNKYSFVFKNHMNIVNFELNILDEHGDLKKHQKLKTKGTSFKSKDIALEKANKNLVKKLAELL